jgi:hypothetical protein
MIGDIPLWAKKRACELANTEANGVNYWETDDFNRAGTTILKTLARHILQYETKPVDPDSRVVRDILIAWGHSREAIEARGEGGLDFQRALAKYREHKAK